MTDMTVFQATMLAEGLPGLAGYDPKQVDDDLMRQAWQLLVDTGACWVMQGSFGRTAMRLIESGMIEPNRNARH